MHMHCYISANMYLAFAYYRPVWQSIWHGFTKTQCRVAWTNLLGKRWNWRTLPERKQFSFWRINSFLLLANVKPKRKCPTVRSKTQTIWRYCRFLFFRYTSYLLRNVSTKFECLSQKRSFFPTIPFLINQSTSRGHKFCQTTLLRHI